MSALCPYQLEYNVWDEFEESDDHIVPHPSRENRNQISVWNDSWKKPKREAIDSTKDLDIANECIGKHKLNVQSFSGKGSVSENGSWSKEVKTMTSSGTSMANHCLKSSETDAGDSEFCTGDSIILGRSGAIDCDLYHFRVDHISQGDSDLSFLENDQEDKESNELLYYGWQDIGNFDDVARMFRSCDSTFGLGNLSHEEEYCWFGSSRASDGSEHALKPSFKFTCSEGSALEGLAPNNDDFKQMNVCGFDGKNIFVEEKMDAEEHTSLGRIEVANCLKPKSALEDESMNEDQVICFDSSQLMALENPHKPFSDVPGKRFNGNKCQLQTMLHHNVPAAVTRNFQQTTSSVAFDKQVSSIKQVLPSESEMEDHCEVDGIEMGMAGEIDSMNLDESFSMSSLLNEISLEATSFQQLQRVIEQDLTHKNYRTLSGLYVSGCFVVHSSGTILHLRATQKRIEILLPDQGYVFMLDVRAKLCIRDGLYRLARSAEQRHNYKDPKHKIGENKEALGILMVQDTKRCSGFPDMETDTNPIDRSIAHLLFHRPLDSSVTSKNDSCL